MSNFEITQSTYINKNVDLYVNSVHTQGASFLKASATAVTATIAAADILGGIITCAAATGNVQLPLGSALVALFPKAQVGDVISFLFASAGGDMTFTPNTGWTISGAPKVLQYTSRVCYVRFTNVSSGTEACVLY